MEIIRDYSDLVEMATPHPIEPLLERCVKKKILTAQAAEIFLREIKA